MIIGLSISWLRKSCATFGVEGVNILQDILDVSVLVKSFPHFMVSPHVSMRSLKPV
jgi:hypothetical protein